MVDKIIRIKLQADDAKRDIAALDSGMGKLNTTVTRLASAIAAAFSAQQIIAYADAFTNIQNKLRVVTSSTEELTRVTAQLLQVANDSRASFDATADLFSKLTRSTEELGISQSRIIAITSTINKSFAVAGATAEEASNAIRQLGQGLSAGALRGDEFNSVAEQAPGILRAVAAETGKTVGELRDFAAEGGITAELLIRSVENYGATVEAEYAKTNRTFEQSALVAKNNATAFVGASEQVKAATTAAGNAIVLLSENLDVLANALILISSAILSRYISSMAAAAAATISTTTAATASALAMRGLGASLALIGGPVGAAVLAAVGLGFFINQAISSQREAERLANTARGLNSELEKTNKIYENYQKSQQSAAEQAVSGLGQQELQAQFSKSSALVALYKKRIDDLKESGASYARIADVQAKLDAEQNTLDAINKTSPLTAKNTESLALKLGDLAAQINLTSIEYSVFAERQRLIKEGFSTKEIDSYIESYRALLQIQQTNKAKEQTRSDVDSLFSGENNLFSGSGQTSGAAQPSARSEGSAIADNLDRENALIDNALSLRAQAYSTYGAIINDINTGEFERQRAELELQLVEQQNATELAFQQEIARIDERRQQINENTKLSGEEKIEINRLLDEQIILQEQTTQQSLTEISEQAIAARTRLAEAERQTRLLQLGQLGDSLISLGQGQSKKIFKIGQTLALAQAAVALPTAVMESFKNGGGYPWGLVPAATMLATGLKNIQSIKSASFDGGGASASLSGGGGGGGFSQPTLPTTPAAQQNVNTFEIAGINELVSELRNYDGLVPASLAARILDAIPSANRLRGEDV